MLTGFNTNVRRHGLLFHVQTEDSGRAHPHVITHVFHQGTIVATEKQSYEDQLEAPELDAEVRRRMQRQHKGMLIRLRDGELDIRIRERLGLDALPESPAPAPAAQPEEAAAAAQTKPAPASPRPAARPPRPAAAPPPPAPDPAASGPELSADDVVFAYLVEKARKRSNR